MRRRAALNTLTLLLLVVLVAGCAPKRVVTRPGSPDFGGSVVRPQSKPEPGPQNETGREAGSEAGPASRAERAAALAHAQIGRPYNYGGATPAGFDCSGLIFYVYGRVGVGLPRTVRQQIGAGNAVARDRLRTGDLVFFNTSGSGASHVGMYLTDTVFIHAPASGGAVRTDDLNDAYWHRRYVTARRVSTGD